jgi:hypothetical protein
MDKVRVLNKTCGGFAYGRDFIIRPNAESTVDRATWERFKQFPHIAPKIASGDLVELVPVTLKVVPDVQDQEPPTDDDQEPPRKPRRKKVRK